MQIYALDEGKPTVASKASRIRTYTCPECQGVLRVRGGRFKKIHFYHISPPTHCFLSQKSEEHIQIQLYLAEQRKEESAIEHPFPNINRIADVVWKKEKIVFEVQCSFLSLQEAQERSLDYEKEGYHLIWILHDKRFNRHTLSAAEEFLRARGAYYSNFNQEGKGILYDQFEVIREGKRLYKGPPLILPSLLSVYPKRHPFLETLPSPLPRMLEERKERWQCSFAFDLTDHLEKKHSFAQTLLLLQSLEQRLVEKRKKQFLSVWILIRKTYLAILDYLLK